jgi:high frequency lysogenization protein
VRGVASGLRLVKTQLGTGSSVPDREISRYLVTLLHLERKLSNRSDLLDTLRAGIERAQAQAEHFEITHGNLIASLADTYSQTISTLSPRIMVNGDASRLREPATADRIRALLLAAMRSAVLWRQCGGTRIGLLFSRGKLVANADRLLG